jgi:DNA replication and repair protein RecF
MIIDSLRLQQFRSYKNEGFEFDAGVNIIVGPNASGKTNLLEALLVCARGHSFRAKDAELIAFNEPWARLDIMSAQESRTVKLMTQESGLIKKEYTINSQTLSRLTLPRIIPVVLFEPNHLLLLHGSPENRRDYLDDLLEQLVSGYAKTRRDYRRNLAQRNALLKHGLQTKNQLFAWNIRLSETGAILAQQRYELIKQINLRLRDLYQTLAQSKDKVAIHYSSNHTIDNYSTALLHALEKHQDQDFDRGFTSVGPHREDFRVTFNDRETSETASRGETRTVLLALKIIELELIEEARDQKPLLLLDDVFSELDGKRRKALTDSLKNHQTFITTTDADIILHNFTDHCNIIPLDG